MKNKQHILNMANAIAKNSKKYEQLLTVNDICHTLTSDGGIDVTAEIYSGNIVRYLIRGTRCSMTLTFNAITFEIVRKKRNEQPIYTDDFHTYAYNIIDAADAMKEQEKENDDMNTVLPYDSFDYYTFVNKYAVRMYKRNGDGYGVRYTDTLETAETVRTEHGLAIGLEPEPTIKHFAFYPTIWKWNETNYRYERVLGY